MDETIIEVKFMNKVYDVFREIGAFLSRCTQFTYFWHIVLGVGILVALLSVWMLSASTRRDQEKIRDRDIKERK